MPEYATFHNTIFDIRCSKCKKTQENQYFVQNGRVYKTCNECRRRDKTRRAIQFSDNQATPSPEFIYFDIETDTYIHNAPVAHIHYMDSDGVLLLSSSAAAASSSADYFVEEPEMELEP